MTPAELHAEVLAELARHLDRHEERGGCPVLLCLDVLCVAVALGPFELPSHGVRVEHVGRRES